MRIRYGSWAAVMVLVACGLARAERNGTRETERLRDDIHLLNLLNGVCLTVEQAEKLAGIVGEFDHARDVLEKRRAELEAAGLAPLRALRGSLIRGSAVDRSVLAPFHVVQNRAHELKDSYGAHVDGLAVRLAAVLTPNQVELVKTYKPCLAPPREQTHPDRIGSVEAPGDKMGHELDRLRKVPAEQADRALDELVARFGRRPRLRKLGITSESLRGRFAAALTKARAMDDLTYETSREQLVAEARPPGLEREATEPGAPENKLRHLFFFPGAREILEGRVHFLEEHAVLSRVDLSKVEGAHNCSNRRCALND
jgi:hypothetical protein